MNNQNKTAGETAIINKFSAFARKNLTDYEEASKMLPEADGTVQGELQNSLNDVEYELKRSLTEEEKELCIDTFNTVVREFSELYEAYKAE